MSLKDVFTLTILVMIAGSAVIPEGRVLAEDAKGHELTVDVTNIKGKDGSIVISLFSKKEGFPMDHSKADFSQTIKLDEPQHTFKELPAGKYAVLIYHDLNGNGKLDKSPLGFPSEPIGLSNHPKLAPPIPDFDKAKVDVSITSTVSVNLVKVGR